MKRSPEHIVVRLFSQRLMTLFILLLVAGGRIVQLLYYYNINVDGLYQVMAAQNFAHGHGVSIAGALPTDLSAVAYQPLVNWPPGYSWLLAPFYLLFGHDYITAGITLDILFSILMILMSRRILHLLEVPLYLVNLYTLLSGFFIYYFYFVNSTDAIAISLFLVGLYHTLALIRSGRGSALRFTGILLPLLACGLVKYLFIPLVFVVPAYLFLLSFAENKKALRRIALSVAALMLAAFGILLAWQQSTSGTAAYISSPARGFYPEHLSAAWPVIPGSFIKPASVVELIGHKSTVKEPVYRFWQLIHVFLLLMMIFAAARHLLRKGISHTSLQGHYYLLSLSLLIALSMILGVLSIRVGKEEILPGIEWTYIQEPRYFGLINVLLHLGVFVLAGYRLSPVWSRIRLWMLALLILMLPEMCRGMYLVARRMQLWGREIYSWQAERNLQRFAERIIRREQTIHPGEKVLVTGSWYYFYYRIALYSHVPALKEAELLNHPSRLQTSKAVVLLAAIYKDHVKDFSTFLANPEKQFAGEVNGFYFYTLHVGPR